MLMDFSLDAYSFLFCRKKIWMLTLSTIYVRIDCHMAKKDSRLQRNKNKQLLYTKAPKVAKTNASFHFTGNCYASWPFGVISRLSVLFRTNNTLFAKDL
ncbi:hypothetical protein QVD17_25764 [Tagetes erecta]|uniref:Uncharacterized protein n=1 Tax=Tagetes erecta TaxID=13708 RepID=A0AAD8K5A5_TARER|nr:hypothetical protein QVD17_25764 [Tagetes erecta]